MKTKKILHPIDKEILRLLSHTDFKMTPSEIATEIGIHPATAKNHITFLKSEKVIRCLGVGNRTYCYPLSKMLIKKIKEKYD